MILVDFILFIDSLLVNNPLLIFGTSFCFYFCGQMSGENPCATSDTQSVQTTSGPLGQSRNVQSLPYVDPKQPGMELVNFK